MTAFAKAIAAGGAHTCAILDDDTVRCWGFGLQRAARLRQPRSGPGTPSRATGQHRRRRDAWLRRPGRHRHGRTAKAITAGDLHTCAILDDDTVRCWGYGGNGQLGYGNTAQRRGPRNSRPSRGRSISGAPHRWAISAGLAQTCAVLDEGSVRCWGFGGNGRLGYGNGLTIGDDETPGSVPPVNLGADRTARSIGVGGRSRLRPS